MNDDLMKRASDYVIENARYHERPVSPDSKPYHVRFPLSSGQTLRSDDTMDLVRKVARHMSKTK